MEFNYKFSTLYLLSKNLSSYFEKLKEEELFLLNIIKLRVGCKRAFL